jgi:phosphotriesterase-related protein
MGFAYPLQVGINMKARTVLGDISPDDLGFTLPHEHLLDDATCYVKKPETEEKRIIQESPVTYEILGAIRREVCLNRDNLILSSIDDAVSELAKYKKVGGNSLVDVTTEGIGRDPQAVKKISTLAKINVICATGWYIQKSHPDFIGKENVDVLADIMVKELTEEIGHSGVRAGVIKVGCSGPLHPDEKKVLLAAAKAQSKTSAPFTIHLGSSLADEVVSILENDAVLEKVYLSHQDVFHVVDIEEELHHQRQLMDKGVSILYDRFGWECCYDDAIYPGALNDCTDTQRINALVEHCKQGYERNIMLSHDICMKIQIRKYGGMGYGHILEHIVPVMKYNGLSDSQIKTILVENPKRILSW